MKNTSRSAKQIAIFFFFIVVMATTLTSCLKDDNNGGSNQNNSSLMAFNLATDQSLIGFRFGASNVINNGLQYTSYTGSYIPIFGGTRTLEAFDFNNRTALASKEETFIVGKYYSAFLVGNTNNYSTIVVEDELDSLKAESGKAYIRCINAITDSSKPLFTIKNGTETPVNVPIEYKTISSFNPVSIGTITVSIKNELGTINQERTFQIDQNKVYTVLLVGNPASLEPSNAVQIKFIQNGTIQ